MQWFISDEVGGGLIRQDVQEAIQRELNYRLGEGDVPGTLSRWEKELLLTAVNEANLNIFLSLLHARAAIKAGATVEQVRDATLSPILIGMLRWKMAGQWALKAAEEAAKELQGLEPIRRKVSASEDARIGEIKQYVEQVLNRDFASIDVWENLANVAPAVLDGYIRIRESFINYKPQGALPKKFNELIIVSWDITQANSWGAQMHAEQAIRDGATVSQVVEAVALVMVERGVSIYKIGGLEVIEAAEKEAADLARCNRS